MATTMVMSMVVFASLAAGSAALAAGGHVDSDAVLAQAQHGLFVVADGVGGRAAGE